MILTMIVLDR